MFSLIQKPTLSILCCLLIATGAAAQNPVLFKVGKYYNAEKNIFEKNVEVLISNGRVEKVGKNIQAPTGATTVDCGTCTLTPGLIDMHTHVLFKETAGAKSVLDDAINNSDADRSLRAVGIAGRYLRGGFTTIRDLGNSGTYLDISFRNAVRSGRVQGPTVFASGPIISPHGGQTYNLPVSSLPIVDREYRVIAGAEDAKEAVREHVRMGVDVIKICADNTPGNLLLSYEEMKAITDMAHEYGIRVTAHATFDKSVHRAVLAGVDGIEHGYDIADSTLELMKQRKVYLVPTDLSYQGAMKIFALQKFDMDSNYVKEVIGSFGARLMRAYKKGVAIVFGRDYYRDIPLDESEASKDGMLSYFEAGMPVADVLRTATANAADALGRKGQLGVLKEGAVADLVLFDGDLETNFATVLFKTKAVYKRGVAVP